jgi:hypothetical protein
VLGLLSPVLAFSIDSSSGIGALNNIAQPAQSGGIKSGIGFYQPSNPTPEQLQNNTYRTPNK